MLNKNQLQTQKNFTKFKEKGQKILVQINIFKFNERRAIKTITVRKKVEHNIPECG